MEFSLTYNPELNFMCQVKKEDQIQTSTVSSDLLNFALLIIRDPISDLDSMLAEHTHFKFDNWVIPIPNIYIINVAAIIQAYMTKGNSWMAQLKSLVEEMTKLYPPPYNSITK